MSEKTKICPICGKPIYRYAQVCPYCKGETHFVSIDEEHPQEIAEDIEELENQDKQDGLDNLESLEGLEGQESLDDSESDNEKTEKHSHLSEYLHHLKKDTDKVKQEYEEKIGRKYSRSTIIIGSVILVLSLIVLGFFIAVQMMNRQTFFYDHSIDRSVKLEIDSVANEVFQREATIVAKFPDRKRHCLFYLKEGKLCLYDASDKSDQPLDLMAMNPKAVVDEGGSGVLNAYLSPNEKYIIIIASRMSGNKECGLYRLDTESRELEFIDKGRVAPEKGGYEVSGPGHTAMYDASGEKIRGMSSTELEQLAPKMESGQTVKREKIEKKTEERQPMQESVTEHIAPSVDLTPKPEVPKVPEKITITPVSPQNQ